VVPAEKAAPNHGGRMGSARRGDDGEPNRDSHVPVYRYRGIDPPPRGVGEVFGSVLEEHHRLLREAFARHGGIEVANPGDAFVVAFDSPLAAVAAALDAQTSAG
jgi:hypothetical protein